MTDNSSSRFNFRNENYTAANYNKNNNYYYDSLSLSPF